MEELLIIDDLTIDDTDEYLAYTQEHFEPVEYVSGDLQFCIDLIDTQILINQEIITPVLTEPGEKNLYYCTAVKGDDECTLEKTGHLGVAMIAIAASINEIEISWPDTGINDSMGNYAEEWILKPLTANTTFANTERYSKTEAVPWTLDTVKLKMLSPVRKQSQMEDDLESKIKHLATTARWCNPDWFTYDYHQLALIFALELFDFDSADKFPFLMKEDGGLNCPVPWNNTLTVELYSDHFNRGRSKAAIKAIMHESNLVKLGKIKPCQTVCLKGIVAYRSGSDFWDKYVSIQKDLRDGNITELDIQDKIKDSLEVNIPEDLKQSALVVNIDDITMSVIVARLRSSGEILTELDLATFINEAERYSNLFNLNKSFTQLFSEQENKMRKFKSRPLELLNDIAKQAGIKMGSKAIKPDQLLFDDIASAYITVQQRYQSFRTSFNNTGKVRIYRSEDVRKFFDSNNYKDFAESLFQYTFSKLPAQAERLEVSADEQFKWAEVRKWLYSESPFDSVIPIGACTEDARLMGELSKLNKLQETFVILISSDNNLSLMLRELVKKHNLCKSNAKFDYACITVPEYLMVCYKARFKAAYRGLNEFYNYHTNKVVDLPIQVLTDIEKELSRNRSNWRSKVKFKMKPIRFIYDTANIFRYAPNIIYTSSEVKIKSEGFLRAKALRQLKHSNQSIEFLPIKEIPKQFLKTYNKKIEHKILLKDLVVSDL